MKLPLVMWPVRSGNCPLCVEVQWRTGDYSVVMPWWAVGEGNVVNVQCYYRVCETAGHHNPPEVR